MSQTYRDLTAWKRAMDLVTEVYKATERFPKEEVYGLTKSNHITFVHFTMHHHRNVMLSAAKHLVLRPFASLRVTHKRANLVWFDLANFGGQRFPFLVTLPRSKVV
jgi:hypothetical protein